jgi:DNA-binding NarL/FixJ family response regulator
MTNRITHLYFTREEDIAELNPTDDLWNKISSMSRQVIMCTSWSELPEKLKLQPDSICFNYRELKHSSAVEILNMVRTMSKLVGLTYAIKIVVDVGKDTSYETIKLLQKSGIQGIIPRPCDFGWEECLKGSEATWAGIPYWPRHIIEQLPGAKKKIESLVKPGHIQLTTRQKQIFEMVVDRGLSNKIIARTLNISESTVKLHMGHIFKKYGVKSRTQLAVFARQQ